MRCSSTRTATRSSSSSRSEEHTSELQSQSNLVCRLLLEKKKQKMNPLFEQTPAFAQIGRRFCFENKLNLLCDLFNAFAAERHRDPLTLAHRLDRHWKFPN